MSTSYKVALLPGDGTGIEVAEQARRVLEQVSSSTGTIFDIDEIPLASIFHLLYFFYLENQILFLKCFLIDLALSECYANRESFEPEFRIDIDQLVF